MKTSAKSCLLFAATCLAIANVASAQLQTFDTRPNYEGSAQTFSAGVLKGQVFDQVYAVASLTYNFFGGAGGPTAGDTLTATFGQWNGSGFVAGTTVSFGTILVPASSDSSWTTIPGSVGGPYPTFQATFDLTDTNTNLVANSTLFTPVSSSVVLDSTYGYMTTYGTQYALMFSASNSGTNLALGLTNTDVFSGGFAKGNSDYDFVFANISVATSSPVPESGTIAAILGALLVAALVAFRLRQRRQQLALAPVAAG